MCRRRASNIYSIFSSLLLTISFSINLEYALAIALECNALIIIPCSTLYIIMDCSIKCIICWILLPCTCLKSFSIMHSNYLSLDISTHTQPAHSRNWTKNWNVRALVCTNTSTDSFKLIVTFELSWCGVQVCILYIYVCYVDSSHYKLMQYPILNTLALSHTHRIM